MKTHQIPMWREDRLLFFVVLGVSLLSSWLWWVPIRCMMEGEPFRWAMTIGEGNIGGNGMGGHFLILITMSALFISVVFMGWRGGHGTFKPLLIFWCAINAANTLIASINSPDGLRFRGDTMGIDINLIWFMPALKGILLAAAIYWVVREARAPRQRLDAPWLSLNTRFLIPVLVIIPLQIAMLRIGPMNDITDKIGWLLTYCEWILVNLAFIPWTRRLDADESIRSEADSSSHSQKSARAGNFLLAPHRSR